MQYVIAAFKVNQKKPVMYVTASSPVILLKKLMDAFEKGADFISLRRLP